MKNSIKSFKFLHRSGSLRIDKKIISFSALEQFIKREDEITYNLCSSFDIYECENEYTKERFFSFETLQMLCEDNRSLIKFINSNF